jgi:hypothetical protein
MTLREGTKCNCTGSLGKGIVERREIDAGYVKGDRPIPKSCHQHIWAVSDVDLLGSTLSGICVVLFVLEQP